MIIICDYCKQYACPSACPSFEGRLISLGDRAGECYLCESYVYKNDGHYEYNGRNLCPDCARELIPSELLDYLECNSVKEFFDLLW